MATSTNKPSKYTTALSTEDTPNNGVTANSVSICDIDIPNVNRSFGLLFARHDSLV